MRAAQASIPATVANVEQNARDLAREERLLATGSSSTEASEKLDLTNNDARAWGLGPSISWSFPDQAAPRARLRQAKANAAAALAGFDATVLQALKETEQSLAEYGAELDRRQALSDAQENARKAFDLAHDQFLAGALTNLDLLTTEQSLISVDAAVAVSDTALVQDQIAVFKALGGGWGAGGPGNSQ